jgi:hypothetical protein
MTRFLILKGYISGTDGWHTDKNGSLYAVVPVDENMVQLPDVDSDLSVDIEGISTAIKRINERMRVK